METRPADTTHPHTTYDAIVIGARCAGSPTAMLLARKGYRVLLLEKASLPRDVPRGHAIMPVGTALLKHWGLLDRVLASNCPPISKLTLDLGPIALTGTPLLADDDAPVCAPRHGILDKILADAAVEAGAELRENFLVQEILLEDGRVRGVRGHGSDGIQVTEEASVVIGADGLYSLVAQAVQAPQYHVKPKLTCGYLAYFSNLPVDGVTTYVRGNRAIFVYPTNDDKTAIGMQLPIGEFQAFRADLARNFMQVIDLVPELAERRSESLREDRIFGMGDIPNFFRKPYGPGWTLVGDAGYHKDPYTAQGITDAFTSAQWLAEALDAGWSGSRPLEEALADYERQRNEDVLPKYELTCQMANLDEPPPSEIQQLFGALLNNQTETNNLFGTILGTVSIPAFYAPKNLQRILAESGAVPSSSD
jgi:flavin-dependent dehydrogenase